ncbi:uncharacterized protein LOC131255900 isoform X2 [Magnolia sinica]|nr:uncharacterized protein LOC131255900 isoform X2 [Magnolia sinica]XP_058112813.1 uncharacterized protein LOC131255900 isoform X2 [Magnolia sinica]XP_058112814.1 uncharacterized protein LOC131255900 isoform X2 [Magnolia sinica]
MPGNLDPMDAAKNLEDAHIGESDVTAPTNQYNEVDSVAQECVPGTSGMQIVGDMTNEWKMVMDEQTNQYYYWNTMTGETSWEVPDVLVQGMDTTTEQKVSLVVGENGSAVDAHVSGSYLNGETEAHLNVLAIDGPKNSDLIVNVKEKYEVGIGMETWNEGVKGENGEAPNLVPVADQTESNNNPSVISLSMEASTLRDSVSTNQSSVILPEHGGLTTAVEEPLVTISCEDKNKSPVAPIANPDTGTTHSTRLMKYGESLLQRLKVFEGPGGNTQGVDWRSKYILEVEIRLSDCKALSAYGPSLLPFWWHTETQLKHLEMAIDEEISRYAKLERNEMETVHISSVGVDDASQRNARTASEVFDNDKGMVVSTAENALITPDTNILEEVPKEVLLKPGSDEGVKIEHTLTSGSPCSGPVGEAEQENNENPVPVRSIPKTELHAGEDIDMDVDMEVDDETPANDNSEDASSTKSHALPEQPIHPHAYSPSAECLPSVPAEEFSAPPPPDEEMIPPPPPDNEPIPPPPPDEPLYPPPPPYTELMPPLPYTEQYNIAYTVPTYEYYAAPHTEVTNSNYYAHTEAGQIAEPQLQSYYEPVANIFPATVAPVLNPAEPVVYYDVPNGTVPPVPVISGLESSRFYSESGPVSYHDNIASDRAQSVGVAPEPGYGPLPSLKAESNFSTIGSAIEMAAVHAASVSAAAQTTATVVVNENAVATASTAASTATAALTVATVTTSASTVATITTAATKNQAKVIRSKKRTIAVAPTLRSNKKVTSLVDKWKAAKEELHGDEEDEPENAYEILEKKRQREIEQWRARQIASGEAQDNANFQPLGGDWRERVKRKRAESTSEAVQTPPEASTNEKQQPDLIELSKDLPSGWQVYWDESTKQVYYGNTITSETTWTKPTR